MKPLFGGEIMSYLDSKAINFIEYDKVPIATVENTERIILHVTGTIIIINNTSEVHQILKWIREAKQREYDANEYIRFMLIEEGIL